MENTFFTNFSELAKLDKEYVWHPWTQMQTARPFVPIVRGKGSCLYSADGHSFLDGVSSWWVNLHGHAHPHIIQKVQAQLELLEHVSFGDFTHPTAIELAARILPVLPGKMSKIFYSDNGSTAVEIALKMALQYWYNQDYKTCKKKVVCFKNSYHGETFGAMSASGPNDFNKPFQKHLFQVEMIDFPSQGCENHSCEQLEKILVQNETACFIFEPLILGVGGMKIYSPYALDHLIRLCKQYQVITIADEVMTGFGRTGKLFACNYLEESPEIICLSKGITGGFLPLGVTAATSSIYEAFLSDHMSQALLHGHSYTANPLACASALGSLDLLLDEKCSLQRHRLTLAHQNFCDQWKTHPKLKRCESLGTVLVLEFHKETYESSYFQPLRNRLYHYFFDQGILLRPLGNVLFVMPPYCMHEDELNYIYEHIILFLNEET